MFQLNEKFFSRICCKNKRNYIFEYFHEYAMFANVHI